MLNTRYLGRRFIAKLQRLVYVPIDATISSVVLAHPKTSTSWVTAAGE
jgi:hypothetical protein